MELEKLLWCKGNILIFLSKIIAFEYNCKPSYDFIKNIIKFNKKKSGQGKAIKITPRLIIFIEFYLNLPD